MKMLWDRAVYEAPLLPQTSFSGVAAHHTLAVEVVGDIADRLLQRHFAKSSWKSGSTVPESFS
jgi:hypothetical protein